MSEKEQPKMVRIKNPPELTSTQFYSDKTIRNAEVRMALLVAFLFFLMGFFTAVIWLSR